MAEKKSKKPKKVKSTKTKSKTKKTKTKTSSTRSKKTDLLPDSGIVIVDDDFDIDKEKVLEERRAYLEEARSQEASD